MLTLVLNVGLECITTVHEGIPALLLIGFDHVQMGGAPEVATHLERMQPASAPQSRPQRAAALAGALMKPSKHTPNCIFFLYSLPAIISQYTLWMANQ